MHSHSFLGLQRHHSPGVHGQRYKNQLRDLCEDPKESETTNQSRASGKKLMLLQYYNARTHTSVATSAAINNIIFEVVPHLPGLLGALKKHVEGNHFTCNDKVQAAMAKWFQKQREKFYTDGLEELVQHWWHYIKREGDYMETWGTKNEVHNLSYSLCLCSAL